MLQDPLDEPRGVHIETFPLPELFYEGLGHLAFTPPPERLALRPFGRVVGIRAHSSACCRMNKTSEAGGTA